MGVRLLVPVSAAFPPIWLSMRASTAPDLRRDAEIALGVSIQPGGRLPFELVLEERIPIGSGEKSRPAAILIGGISDYRLDHGFMLEGYGQAGLVGARSPDLFADGRLTLSRDLAGPVRAGMGVWGAIQPHVGRVDIGPVINLPTKDLRLTVEWRFRIAGDARPASGPSVTLGKDF